MKLLYLTFYFEPDLCAGSFRNSPLVNELSKSLNDDDQIYVITTKPNRYNSIKIDALEFEDRGNVKIYRISIPTHKSGFFDQIRSFVSYFFSAIKLTKGLEYDLVFASSSRLFTAFLAKFLTRRGNPLYLDIRDIFVDTLQDVLKSRVTRFFIIPLLKAIEAYTFRNASHINLVSMGFKQYFSKFDRPKYSYFSNGVDLSFLNKKVNQRRRESRVITYAGNVGEGQGLEKIIPQMADRNQELRFRIIGDGSAKRQLQESINSKKLSNVELLNPVRRDQLLDYYADSDFLFLHLNDYEAFKKVLPSKLFEYGAIDLPIIAGVAGYAAEFIESEIVNHILFQPGNVEDFQRKFEKYQYRKVARDNFVENYSREKISEEMAKSILKLAP